MEDGEEEKGVEKESRDWSMAGLRQTPSSLHGGALSTKQLAAPSVY